MKYIKNVKFFVGGTVWLFVSGCGSMPMVANATGVETATIAATSRKDSEQAITREDSVRLLLRIEPKSFQWPVTSEDQGMLTIENNTDECYVYSTYNRIESFRDGQWTTPWKKVEGDVLTAFHTVRCYVNPHSKMERWFVFQHMDVYDYLPGRYRVVQRMTNNRTGQNVNIYTEFLIEDNRK